MPVAVPRAAGGDDVADRPVVDLLDRLDVALLVPPLRAGDDREVLLLRLLDQREALADAGRVHGHRLLAEDVLPGLDRGLEVDRAEARRRGEDDEVDAGVEHLLVGVEPVEGRLRGDLDLVGELAGSCSSALFDLNARTAPSAWLLNTSPTATISTFGFAPLICASASRMSRTAPRAAAAAADQADLDRLVAGGERAGRGRRPAATPAAAEVFRKSRRFDIVGSWES